MFREAVPAGGGDEEDAMPCSFRAPAALLAMLIVAGCASNPAPREIAAPAPIVAPVMPVPPRGAAPGQTIPQRLANGSYATPNRNLSPAASVWHLRSALNVAALACDDPQGGVSALYNRMLTVQKRPLADAHRALKRDYPKGEAFDLAMTRLYNYFSQPPAHQGFCAASRNALTQAVAVAPEAFDGFAVEALASIERPFVEFYAAYDRYRADLAAWQSGEPSPPRLASAAGPLLAGDERVTGDVSGTSLATR